MLKQPTEKHYWKVSDYQEESQFVQDYLQDVIEVQSFSASHHASLRYKWLNRMALLEIVLRKRIRVCLEVVSYTIASAERRWNAVKNTLISEFLEGTLKHTYTKEEWNTKLRQHKIHISCVNADNNYFVEY